MKILMKKSVHLVTFALLTFTVLVISGCGCEEATPTPETTPETETPTPTPTPVDETIEIVFWHAWGTANQDLVDDMFESFQQAYPELNVSLRQVGQGSFDDLRGTMTYAIPAGNTPTMVVGYPDHFVGYLEADALYPLNAFIDDAEHGVDLDDFVVGFMEENKQFGENIYSLPLAKSTEMVVYNKSVFDHWKSELGEDFLHPEDLTRAITWDDLEAWAPVIIGDGEHQCEFLFNADSAANFFITSSRQWGAPYTDAAGNVLVDNETTIEMLEYMKARFDDDILVLPIEWDQRYGSTNFIAGDVCMTQGSTAGTTYNIPLPGSEEMDEFEMAFEIGILPVVQNTFCPIDPSIDPSEINPRCSAMQQGPNVAILSNTTVQEREAAWLFIRHMTNTENTRMFAQATGYIPIRYSAFNSAEYQAFLQTDDPDEIPFAQAAWAAYNQVNFYGFDPAFTGTPSSSDAREEVGNAIESLYGNSVTFVMNELRASLNLD